MSNKNSIIKCKYLSRINVTTDSIFSELCWVFCNVEKAWPTFSSFLSFLRFCWHFFLHTVILSSFQQISFSFLSEICHYKMMIQFHSINVILDFKTVWVWLSSWTELGPRSDTKWLLICWGWFLTNMTVWVMNIWFDRVDPEDAAGSEVLWFVLKQFNQPELYCSF